MNEPGPHIGLLNEKPLHASLKTWYAQPGDEFEVPVDGYVIDIVRDGHLLEIQTGNLSSIKTKLATLMRSHPIRVIVPIASEKWIVRRSRNGRGSGARRKSPKRGRWEDVFWDAVSIPQLVSDRNFSLEVLLIQEEEARRYRRNGSWRRRGWVVEERRLLDVVDRMLLEEPTDWLTFLPEIDEPFTARDLADLTGMRLDLAQKMAYFFRKAGLVELAGKRGKANLYELR